MTFSHGALPSHHASLRASSMRSPLGTRTSLYGPVPMAALPELKSSVLAFAKALLMIATCVMSEAISGYGSAVLKRNRVRIDDFDLADLLGVRGERRRAVRHLGNALDRCHDVGRREVAAVVELHAAAQLEFPGRRIDRLPFGREAGDAAAISRCAARDSRTGATRRCCWASGCDSADRVAVTSVPSPMVRFAANSGNENADAASATETIRNKRMRTPRKSGDLVPT